MRPRSDKNWRHAFACGLVAMASGCAPAKPPAPVVPPAPLAPPAPEALRLWSGDEPRYLAFQIFLGTPDPAIPFETEIRPTPKAKVLAVVQEIARTVGVRRGPHTRLAFMVGPLAPDHTDEEARQVIDDAFDIALETDVAVGIHLDDAMFWSRTDAFKDPANIELGDWGAKPSVGFKLDWAKPPAKLCFNAPAIRQEVTRRARDVIGARIAARLAALDALGKRDLFAGVIAGWETHMGQDVATEDRLGYRALANRGFGPSNPPGDVKAEVAAIVAEYIGLWTAGLAAGGVPQDRLYSHVAFIPRASFDAMKAATPNFPPVDYETVLDVGVSTQRPSVAFGDTHRAGFSTYPGPGLFPQLYGELAAHGSPPWASAEGTNILPGQGPDSSGMGMETYLARSFNHGATLATVFAWGVGGEAEAATNPFRIVTQREEALKAYRKFLAL